MNWPPVKAWTSRRSINNQRCFVAINYGGNYSDRWVNLMSVLDGSVCIKISWLELCDELKWNCGWEESHSSDSSGCSDNNTDLPTISCNHSSIDSGLSIPITKKNIRPWFVNI